jgi:hypothetical protein
MSVGFGIAYYNIVAHCCVPEGTTFERQMLLVVVPAILAALAYPLVVEWSALSMPEHRRNFMLVSVVAPVTAFFVFVISNCC